MKLEPDLIMKILEYCEEHLPDDEVISARSLKFEGFSDKQVFFHAQLLNSNNYIEGRKIFSIVSPEIDFEFFNLTLGGYQYLNLLRSKTWNTAKALMHEGGVIFAEAAIKAVIDKVSLPI